MNWIYRNDSNAPAVYRSMLWKPHEQHEVAFPVPPSLGLTCIQEGSTPDPALLHTDIIIQPGGKATLDIPPPSLSHKIALTINCMTPFTGCECRFNSERNTVIPIDVRGFNQVTSWENCAKIFLFNPTDTEAHISVSAIEEGD